ncbi:MAG TPA: hypothetical protein VEB03_00810 [Candidatus Nanoarchaeia archaeon]|nr:hypothetical protein [Candidatus Nanoarchaeia archaeon]
MHLRIEKELKAGAMVGRWLHLLVFLVFEMLDPFGLAAQVTIAGSPNPHAEASVSDTITISVLASTINFELVNGRAANRGSSPLSVTTSWDVQPRGTVAVYAYFDNPSAALLHTTPGVGSDIPASRVEAQVNGGRTQTFTGASPAGTTAGITVFTMTIVGSNRRGTRSDSLQLNINLQGTNIEPDTYRGVLRIRAQAF